MTNRRASVAGVRVPVSGWRQGHLVAHWALKHLNAVDWRAALINRGTLALHGGPIALNSATARCATKNLRHIWHSAAMSRCSTLAVCFECVVKAGQGMKNCSIFKAIFRAFLSDALVKTVHGASWCFSSHCGQPW
eukprot:19605-Heterococcus_DN1.PRE.1